MMIISCPSCARRYLVDDGVLAANKQMSFRCAVCAHSWVRTSDSQVAPVPEVSAPAKTVSEAAAAPSSVGVPLPAAAAPMSEAVVASSPPATAASAPAVPPASDAPPTDSSLSAASPPSSAAPSAEALGDGEDYFERRRQRLSAQPLAKESLKDKPAPRKGGLTFGWIIFLATLLALLGVFVFGQGQLIRFWPPFQKFYGIFGVKESAADRRALTLENVTAQIVEKEGGKALVIVGTVANTSSKSARLSELKVHVLSPCQEGMCPSQGRRLPISAGRILAGERILFESPSLAMPPPNSQVVVEF